MLENNKIINLHFLVVQQHAIHLPDSIFGCFFRIKVNKPVAFRVAVFSLSNLTGKNVAEGTERIVQGFVIDALVQVLDKNVPNARLLWVADHK